MPGAGASGVRAPEQQQVVAGGHLELRDRGQGLALARSRAAVSGGGQAFEIAPFERDARPRRSLRSKRELRRELGRDARNPRILVDPAQHRAAQLAEVVRGGHSDDQRSLARQHARELVARPPAVDRQHQCNGAVEKRQPAIGVCDDPGVRRVAARGQFDRVRRQVDADAVQARARSDGRQVAPVAAAQVGDEASSAGLELPGELDQNLLQRRAEARVEQLAARKRGLARVTRVERTPILRLQQAHIAAARDIEAVPALAAPRLLVAFEPQPARADAARQRGSRGHRHGDGSGCDAGRASPEATVAGGRVAANNRGGAVAVRSMRKQLAIAIGLVVALGAVVALTLWRGRVGERAEVTATATEAFTSVERRSEASRATDDEGELDVRGPDVERTPAATAAHSSIESAALAQVVRVEVLDRDARAVDRVRVSLFLPESLEWSEVDTQATDEHGRVEFSLAELEFSDQQTSLRIATPFVACEPQYVEFATGAAPTEVVRLVVGGTSSVAVQVTDAQGSPLELPVRIRLTVDDERDEDLEFGLANGSWAYVSTRDGRAAFERVGLGLPLVAHARSDALEILAREFESPSGAGERVDVALAIERARTVMTGRAVDSVGAPLAGRRVELRAPWTHPDGSQGDLRLAEDCEIDSDGRFECFIAYWRPGRMGATLDVTARRAGEPRAIATIAAPRPTTVFEPAPHELFDLGEVVLTVVPAYVCGQVLDADDEPVCSAQVQLLSVDPREEPTVLDVAQTGELGEFDLHFDGNLSALRIAAVSDDHESSEPQLVQRGQTHVIVRVARSVERGAIRGALALPEGADGAEFSLELGAHAPAHADRGYSLVSTGDFVFEGIAPGHYELSVALHGQQLARLDDIEVVSGKTTLLEPVDLHGGAHALAVHVRDAAGAPVREAVVRVHALISPVSSVQTDARGWATLTSLSASHDLLVWAVGFRPQVVHAATSCVQVVLEAGLDVRVERPALGESARDFELRCTLSYLGPELRGVRLPEFELALSGEAAAHVQLPFEGRYELVSANWIRRVTGIAWPVELAHRPSVTVAGETLTLEWPTAALLEALGRARAR